MNRVLRSELDAVIIMQLQKIECFHADQQVRTESECSMHGSRSHERKTCLVTIDKLNTSLHTRTIRQHTPHVVYSFGMDLEYSLESQARSIWLSR